MDLEFFFLLLLTGRFLMSPERVQWESPLVLQLIFWFCFNYRKNQHKRGLFFSFILLFILLSLYRYGSTGVIRDMNILVVCIWSLAAAGGLQFICLSKTEGGQTDAIMVYLLSNVLLGFILKKEGPFYNNSFYLNNYLILSLFRSNRSS